MEKRKNIYLYIAAVLFAVAVAFCLTLCCCTKTADDPDDKDKIRIIATNFPGYDFAVQIAGDRAEVTMLLAPGEEAHSYEPSPKDITAISKCDLFIYTGGENDAWVAKVLGNIGNVNSFRMTDCVVLLDEETVEGMQTDGEEHGSDHEKDTHVWLSPRNAVKIVEKLAEKLIAADPDGQEQYEKNLAAYKEQLADLDTIFRDIVAASDLKTIVVGDRFPFLYLVREYGLEYSAAFPGCAEDSEPGAKTVAFLIDKVRAEKIPCVFYIEFSNMKTAKAIAAESGAETALLHSCHNITKAEMQAGTTYISLMKANAQALEKALNRG